jgi:hypothetical protein
MSANALHQLLATPASELAEQTSESLFRIKSDAADLFAAAKTIVEHVDRAVELKYAHRAQQLRLAAGKDSGVVHFDDDPVHVTADLPKKGRVGPEAAGRHHPPYRRQW